MIHQSMSAGAVQARIDAAAQKYGAEIRSERLTITDAHGLLTQNNLSLFEIAGLAKAIACFQCSQEAA